MTPDIIAALEAFADALDIADRLIERGYGMDVPDEWNAAFKACAEARAALSTSPAGQEVRESEIDQAKSEGMDQAADFCIQTLAKALGVDDWQQADGSETWDGDVAGTIYNVLKAGRVYDDEDGRVARLEDASVEPAGKILNGLAEAAAYMRGEDTGAIETRVHVRPAGNGREVLTLAKEALDLAHPYVADAVKADGGIEECDICLRRDLEKVEAASRVLSSPPAAEQEAVADIEQVGLNIAERIRQEMASSRQWWREGLTPGQLQEFETELASTCVAVCEAELAPLYTTHPAPALDGARAALVCQDGQEMLPIPWDRIAAVFIGGSTSWKCSAYVAQIIKTAKLFEKWVHVGRVNDPARFQHFEELGADSIDGTGLARYSHMRAAIANRGQMVGLFDQGEAA